MIKILSFSLLLAMVAGNVFAQKNLQPAYVVTNNNDTLRGVTDYRESIRNPDKVSFGTSGDAMKAMPIDEVRSFCIVGKELYRRFTVHTTMYRNLVFDNSNEDTSSQVQTVLLKVLYDGSKASLYSYADRVKTRLYAANANEPVPVELRNTQYLVNGQVISQAEYKVILMHTASLFMPGNTTITERIHQTNFYKDEIEQVVADIDGGKNIASSPSDEKKLQLRLFAGAGIGLNGIIVDGDNRYAGITTGPNMAPVIAAGFDFIRNRYVGKLVWRTEFAYTNAKTDAYTFKEYFASKEHYYFKFSMRNISINEMVNYNFYNTPSLKVFAGAGIGLNFSSYPDNEEKFVREATTDTTTNVHSNYIAYKRTFWVNPLARAGVAVKNIEASILYAPASTFSLYGGFSCKASMLRLQVNYLFNRK